MAQAGRLIAVVGPSGVGKDSLMEALCASRPEIASVRRVITRPSSAGGEAFEGVTDQEFAARQAQNEFVLHWQAHGLSYAIPRSQTERMDEGLDLLVNLSRSVLAQAHALFGDQFLIFNVTAPRAVLAARLEARGRETAEDIARRLDRIAPLPKGLPVTTIDNGGVLDDAVRQALDALDAHRT